MPSGSTSKCHDNPLPTFCADGVPTIRALATVTINTFALPIQEIKTETELDFSNKGLEVEEAIVIAALIPLNVSEKSVFFCYCLSC